MVPGMEFQNQVRQSLLADFTRLQRLLANEVFARRSEVADRVCEAFGFRDGRGRLQRAGCLKALAEFEAAGRISLPLPTHSGGGARSPQRLAEPIPLPRGVPERVGAVEALKLVLVTDHEHRLEYDAGGRTPARVRSVGRLSVALSGGFRAWLAGSCGVRGLGVSA